MSPRRRKRLVRIGAVVVLLGAILPNVAFLGHWTILGLEATVVANEESHDHASHCHGNSSCADEVGYGLQWWSEGEDTLVLDSGAQREQAPLQTPSPAEPVTPPLDPPPRYA